MEIPAIIHKPTFSKVRAIIDGAKQMLRALPTLGVNVKHWDPFVNLIIITKLDEDTRHICFICSNVSVYSCYFCELPICNHITCVFYIMKKCYDKISVILSRTMPAFDYERDNFSIPCITHHLSEYNLWSDERINKNVRECNLLFLILHNESDRMLNLLSLDLNNNPFKYKILMIMSKMEPQKSWWDNNCYKIIPL